MTYIQLPTYNGATTATTVCLLWITHANFVTQLLSLCDHVQQMQISDSIFDTPQLQTEAEIIPSMRLASLQAPDSRNYPI